MAPGTFLSADFIITLCTKETFLKLLYFVFSIHYFLLHFTLLFLFYFFRIFFHVYRFAKVPLFIFLLPSTTSLFTIKEKNIKEVINHYPPDLGQPNQYIATKPVKVS